jgi:hypothetical protein
MGKMRKPTTRLAIERASDNEKRQLRDPAPDAMQRTALAARAHYEGWGKHKLNPRAFNLEPVPSAADDTFCDGHAGFSPADIARAPVLLNRGILAGLIGHIDKQGDPTVLWTVDDNGWIYEGRITVPTQALYHAYPLLPNDAFAKKVIERYSLWINQQDAPELHATLVNALDRYR